MAFAKNIGKKKKIFNLHEGGGGGVNVFVPRLITNIYDTPPPPKNNPLNAISDAQFWFKQLKQVIHVGVHF